jgi:hypothetical protein
MLKSFFPFGLTAEFRFYFTLGKFRFREPFTDIRSTGVTYFLYCFFIWLLSQVWFRYNAEGSVFSYAEVFLYIGVTEMLFMSFLNLRQISNGSEDFALFLTRPRSWLGREIVANIGSALGKRIMFLLSLMIFSSFLGLGPAHPLEFVGRVTILLGMLSLPQALIATLFSTLRLSYPQTDYFVLPFSKLFLALGGVFGPLSDYGEPWREIFLYLPGSDLFFQPAYFAVHGSFYQTSPSAWAFRQVILHGLIFGLVLFFYRKGRRSYQAWGG